LSPDPNPSPPEARPRAARPAEPFIAFISPFARASEGPTTMTYETEAISVSSEASPSGRPRRKPRRATFAGLPRSTVLAERAAAWLRAYVGDRGLRGYIVFCGDFEFHDLDEHLAALCDGAGGGAVAEAPAWRPVPSLVPGGVQPTLLRSRGRDADRPGGVLHLPSYRLVLVRWHWYCTTNTTWYTLWLCAAPQAEDVLRLRKALRDRRRAAAAYAWQVVSGPPYRDGERLVRGDVRLDDLTLDPAVRRRLETEVVGFFAPAAADLYRKLGVPHRRGVLMYGPPGNGKTSIIRALAADLPHVAGLVLRAAGNFGDNEFSAVIKRWASAAPAVLVIEDLNWLLASGRVNVSTFLNLLDGLDSPRGGAGLLLMASTNHPDQLDPAVNDRPGRFDVMLEIPSPSRALRRAFFRRALPDLPDGPTLAKLASETAGLSFAHLREVLQASGLSAIRAGRDRRTDEDLLAAAGAVSAAHRAAHRGFPIPTEEPFGLARLRAGARDAED
jgi:hypothetical protein